MANDTKEPPVATASCTTFFGLTDFTMFNAGFFLIEAKEWGRENEVILAPEMPFSDEELKLLQNSPFKGPNIPWPTNEAR